MQVDDRFYVNYIVNKRYISRNKPDDEFGAFGRTFHIHRPSDYLLNLQQYLNSEEG